MTLQHISLLAAKLLPVLAMINSAIDIYIERRNRWKLLKAIAVFMIFAALTYVVMFVS